MKKLFLLLFGIFILSPFLNAQNDGSIDESFYSQHTFNGSISTTFIQEDGKILIGGDFNMFDNLSCDGIVRLNVDGTLDNSFQPNFNESINENTFEVFKIIADHNGKVLICLQFFDESGYTGLSKVLRLHNNGSLDTTFNQNLSGPIFAMELLPSGKILIGGCFFSIDQHSAPHLARLDQNGFIDTTFTNTLDFSAIVYNIKIDQDNKIYVIGSILLENDPYSRSYRILRLHPNGRLDTTFNTLLNEYNYNQNNFNDITIHDAVIDSYGKITVTGTSVVRLLNNGAIDPTFESPFPTVATEPYFISHSNIQIDHLGRYLVARYNLNNSENPKYFYRLLYDGTVDTSFHTGSGFDGGVHTFSIQKDNKIVITGNFTNYNGISVSKIIRIIGDINTINIDENIQNPFSVFPNPVIDNLYIKNDLIDDVVNVNVYDMNGKLVYQSLYSTQTIIPMNHYPAGNYMIVFKTSKGNFSRKVVKL